MEPTLSSLLIGVGTVAAAFLMSLAVQIRGRADTAKDAEKLRIEQQKTRDASEKAFRDAFTDIKHDFDRERDKNDRLGKRIGDLVENLQSCQRDINGLTDRNAKQAEDIATLENRIVTFGTEATARLAEIAALTGKLTNVTANLATVTAERNEALKEVQKQNGEIQHRDEQIKKLTSDLEKAQTDLISITRRVSELEHPTGALDKNEAAVTAMKDALKEQDAPDSGSAQATKP